VIYPRGAPRGRSGDLQRRLRPALVPATWLYRTVADSVNRVRALERYATPDSVTVISVGNLEAGGSGKTPLCMHLLERLRERGTPCAYVSRGFGSRAERFDGVTVVGSVSDAMANAGAGVRWVAPGHPRLSAEVGDEGAMIARRIGDGVPLLFCRNKARAVAVAAGPARGGVIVLDDAFQSWNVARDLDVVLLDAQRPFADGWLVPAGRLREEPAALARAGVILFNGARDDEAVSRALGEVRRRTGLAPRAGALRRELRLAHRPHGPVVAVSAIARPDSFEGSLCEQGVDVVAALRYPDHHAFTMDDVAFIRDTVAAAGGECMVTEKDWAKLEELGAEAGRFRVARLDVRVVGANILPET
jgi:tetraacyldisaccharide 4'-kinase